MSFDAPGRDLAEDQLLGDAAAHRHRDLIVGGLLRDVEAILGRQLLGEPQRAAARDDRDLVDRVRPLHHLADQRVSRLVVGGDALVVLADDHRAALGAHQDLVLRHLEVVHVEAVLLGPRRPQRRFVDQVLEVGAREAGRAARDDVQIDVGAERGLLGVHLEDAGAPLDVGPGHDDPAVEAAGAQQRRVEHVGPVGGGDQDDAVVRLEAVHLDEQLVQRLLALVVTTAEARAAVATDGVDLVDEDDAGGVLLPLLEQVAHAAGADAHEHLDEVRARDREERHARLAGDGAGQQRLTGSRRSHHEHTLGDAPAEPGELLRVLEEVDDLLDLVLRLFDAGDVERR